MFQRLEKRARPEHESVIHASASLASRYYTDLILLPEHARLSSLLLVPPRQVLSVCRCAQPA